MPGPRGGGRDQRVNRRSKNEDRPERLELAFDGLS
jgi:hypothetical protein